MADDSVVVVDVTVVDQDVTLDIVDGAAGVTVEVGGVFTDSTGSGGVTQHNLLEGRSAADAHPMESITGLPQALASKEPSGAAATVMAAHEAANDPHDQYQKESEKGQAGGYASLDGQGKVPASQLPASGGGGDLTQVAADARYAPGRTGVVATDGTVPVIRGEVLSALLVGPSEDVNARTVFLGNLMNALTQWVGRGCTASVSSTGTGVTPTTSGVLATLRPDFEDSPTRCTIGVGATPAGSGVTMTILRGTAPTLSVWGSGKAQPYVRLRLANAALRAQVEWTLDGTTWIEVLPMSAANAANGTAWIGQERTIANMPVGVRVTFDHALMTANTLYYVLEIGVLQRNLPFGSAAFAKSYAPNLFRGVQTFNDPIKIIPGAAAGKVLTSDADGDASWQDPVGGRATTTTIFLNWNGAQFRRSDTEALVPNDGTRPTDLPLYPNGNVFWHTGFYEDFTIRPPGMAPGDTWVRNSKVSMMATLADMARALGLPEDEVLARFVVTTPTEPVYDRLSEEDA